MDKTTFPLLPFSDKTFEIYYVDEFKCYEAEVTVGPVKTIVSEKNSGKFSEMNEVMQSQLKEKLRIGLLEALVEQYLKDIFSRDFIPTS